MKRQPTMGFFAALVFAFVAPTALAQTRPLKVSPERLANYWLLANSSVDATIPNGGRGLSQPGCAAVSYTIGTDGVTRDIKVRKVVPKTSDFASIAVSIIRQFHYQLGPNNDLQRPVSTYYIVPFNLAKTSDGGKATTKACALPGY